MGRGQDLLDAARKGDEQSVEKILGQITKRSGPFPSIRRGPGVNVQDDNGYTPLHHACLQGHKEIVRLLLSVDASPCMVDKKGATPLHLAAWKGDLDIVRMLLAHNNPRVDVNQVTQDNETALLMAAQFGFVNVVAELMERNADVTIRNVKDESALDLAAQYGRLQTVKHLIRVHPMLIYPYKFPNWKVQKFSTTPLHRASMNGHEDVVKVLLRAGIDPNIRTDSGTPLHEAACFGKASVVRILLDHGADLNAVDGRDKTIEELLAVYSEEATRRVRKVIREYKNRTRNNYESEDDFAPFPVHDHSPTFYQHNPMKAQETKNTNNLTDTSYSSSSSFLTKNTQQSFVKKLASKYLGLKAKFNSAPNISNTKGLESGIESKLKQSDSKSNTNALHTGNSIFFKILSKKDSGDVACNDEFDTISLDRLGTLNRDSCVNRSNRSCPGFKTSLPNISENNELSDSHDSINNHEMDEPNYDINNVQKPTEAINVETKYVIFEPRTNDSRVFNESNKLPESASKVNECYESYEFSAVKSTSDLDVFTQSIASSPRPLPRSKRNESEQAVYENLSIDKCVTNRPKPAVRTHVPLKKHEENVDKKSFYENILPLKEKPEPFKRSCIPLNKTSSESSASSSRTSSCSSDSMIDETNLEDILISEKSKSFRHSKTIQMSSNKSTMNRSQSSDSNFTDITGTSAIENVDCSDYNETKAMYLSTTGTLPAKKVPKPKKKVLFRHKTFTDFEVDRNSTKNNNFTINNKFTSKDTLANYHIRGTGHCIFKAPTVQEFLNIFNRDTLCTDALPLDTVDDEHKRDSYFETAICFCKQRPLKHHKSAEDLLEMSSQDDDAKVSIDFDNLRNKIELFSTSFRCFCDEGVCTLHAGRRDNFTDFVVKFSAIKKSMSTPDITLLPSPSSTNFKSGLTKNKSVPSNLVEPCAADVKCVIDRSTESSNSFGNVSNYLKYVQVSPRSSLSSSDRPYSIKDIAEVISLNTISRSTDTNLSCISGTSLRKSSSSEYSGHWSLQSCNSNLTVISDTSFKTCIEESSSDDGSIGTVHSEDESSDADTVKSDVSTTKRPWVHSSSFRYGNRGSKEPEIIEEEDISFTNSKLELSKVESGISVQDSDSSSSECEGDSGVPGSDAGVSLDASLEHFSGVTGGVRSGSGRRRWEEAEGTSEGDALSVSSAASSCAPMHLAHHHEYNKVSPTPPKKPPRRNLSVSPTHVNSPSSGYSYELRTHARSQDDLDDIQGAKHYLKHGRSVDQYVDGKLSYSEYEENHNSPRAVPVPNPRPSLKNRTQPVAITAMYENVVIKEQNPRRKLRRNNLGPQYENFETRMADKRVRKYSNQERSSQESLLDDQSMNSPSDYERYFDGSRIEIPLSPSHYEQPPTPDHPPPSAKQAENSIHERIRPLSQLIMEVVEEIRIRNKSQGDVLHS